jgi:leader peptidase (prepilin peptidase)/N-methyltransferase
MVRWYDNIPLFSFLILRGRCRDCRKVIPIRYPIVEVITAVLSFLVYQKFHAPLPYLFYFVLFAAPLIAITFIDLDHYIIPDSISLPGIVVGFIACLVLTEEPLKKAAVNSILGILSGGGSLFLVSWFYEKVRHQEGIGGGDVKLAAMLGAFLGWKGILFVLLMSSFLGSFVGILVMIIYRKGLKLALPFGPFLAAGALIYLFCGHELVHWYLGLTTRIQ